MEKNINNTKDMTDTVRNAMNETMNRAEDFIDAAKDKTKELKDVTMGTAADVLGVTEDAAEELKEKAKSMKDKMERKTDGGG